MSRAPNGFHKRERETPGMAEVVCNACGAIKRVQRVGNALAFWAKLKAEARNHLTYCKGKNGSIHG